MNRYSIESNDLYDSMPDANGVWVLYDEANAEIERNRAAIAELVGALKNVLPEVSVCGLPGQLEMLRALIAKHQQPPISEQSHTTTKE